MENNKNPRGSVPGGTGKKKKSKKNSANLAGSIGRSATSQLPLQSDHTLSDSGTNVSYEEET